MQVHTREDNRDFKTQHFSINIKYEFNVYLHPCDRNQANTSLNIKGNNITV